MPRTDRRVPRKGICRTCYPPSGPTHTTLRFTTVPSFVDKNGQVIVASALLYLAGCRSDASSRNLDGGPVRSRDSSREDARGDVRRLPDASREPASPRHSVCDGGNSIGDAFGVPRPPVFGDATAASTGGAGDVDASTRCALASPCLYENYEGTFHFGTITCSEDGRWWAVLDTYGPPGQLIETEEVYVARELCYRRSRIGLLRLGPGSPVEQVTETGVAPEYPACTPGCCPFRTP